MEDKVAEEFCWRGTATKNKVQGLTTTLALRSKDAILTYEQITQNN